jgi:hypothetical protein
VTEDDGVQRPNYSILSAASVGEGRGASEAARPLRERGRVGRGRALARFFEKERRRRAASRSFVDRVGMPRLTSREGRRGNVA